MGAQSREAGESCNKGLSFRQEEKYQGAVRSFAAGLTADPNHVGLQLYLGGAYYLGLGVPKRNDGHALTCRRKAPEQGHAQGKTNLSRALGGRAWRKKLSAWQVFLDVSTTRP